MDNQEKMGTQGTQDEDKQNTTQYELDTTMHKQTQITNNTSNGAISISIFRKIETVNPTNIMS